MSYSLLNTIFLGLAFWFFVVAFVLIGVQMRRESQRRSSITSAPSGDAGRSSATLAPPKDARRTPGQSTETPTAESIEFENVRKQRGRGLIWKYAGTLIVLLVFTAVFDNVIVGLGIVAYDPAKLSGLYIGVVPIEDFAYSIAAVLILPTLWGVLGHLKRSDKPGE